MRAVSILRTLKGNGICKSIMSEFPKMAKSGVILALLRREEGISKYYKQTQLFYKDGEVYECGLLVEGKLMHLNVIRKAI